MYLIMSSREGGGTVPSSLSQGWCNMPAFRVAPSLDLPAKRRNWSNFDQKKNLYGTYVTPTDVNTGHVFFFLLFRYVFAHWIAYIIAFVGIYSARFDKDVPYTIYALVLLALVSALALTKLTVMIIRAVLDPIRFPTSDVKKVAYGVHYVKMQN